MLIVTIARRSCSHREQIGVEGDRVDHAGFTAPELAFSNGAEGFDTGERGLGFGQRLKPPHGTQALLQCGMLTLDPIVQILEVDVADGISGPSGPLIPPITYAELCAFGPRVPET